MRQIGVEYITYYQSDSMSFQEKHKKSESENFIIKQQTNFFSKILPFFTKIFSLDVSILPEVAVLKLVLVYMKILEITHVALLYSVFTQTNSTLYLLLSSILSAFQILTYFIIRFSIKFMAMKVIGIVTMLTAIGEFGVSMTFIINLVRFNYFCKLLSNYYQQKPEYPPTTLKLCSNIQAYFYGGIILSLILIGSRIAAVAFMVKAYKVAKHQYDENEMKRRRKDKYNQLLLKSHGYNKDRQL